MSRGDHFRTQRGIPSPLRWNGAEAMQDKLIKMHLNGQDENSQLKEKNSIFEKEEIAVAVSTELRYLFLP